MTSKQQSLLFSAIVILAVLADQALKLYVRTHFYIGESVEILPFFSLCLVENDGMAFGIEWFDKIFLTLFRMLAVGALAYYAHLLINRQHTRTGYVAMIALVTAGALGNIIDCVCYGKLFGYATWLYGKVVDMFAFSFFPPVFNLADSCITVAVFAILIWFRKDLDQSLSIKGNA